MDNLLTSFDVYEQQVANKACQGALQFHFRKFSVEEVHAILLFFVLLNVYSGGEKRFRLFI